MKKRTENGFTLIELIVIIVVVGITLPLVVMPFVNAATAVAQPGEMAMLASVTRANMEKEIAGVDNSWPSVSGPAFSEETINETVSGRLYATTVARRYVDSTFADTDGNPAANNDKYLIITVSTTDPSGNRLTLQAVKARDY